VLDQGLAGEQIVLVTSLLAAFCLALAYLRWRGHLGLLRALYVPAVLLVAFSIPDALLTLGGVGGSAAREANPYVRAFLVWAGWRGLCLAFATWVLGWTLYLDILETLRERLLGRAASALRLVQLYTLYALALGHLDGLSAWTHSPVVIYDASWGLLAALRLHAAWSMPSFPLAYLLYPALTYALACTLLHAALASMAGRLRRNAEALYARILAAPIAR
jgi:hypothetical protein